MFRQSNFTTLSALFKNCPAVIENTKKFTILIKLSIIYVLIHLNIESDSLLNYPNKFLSISN